MKAVKAYRLQVVSGRHHPVLVVADDSDGRRVRLTRYDEYNNVLERFTLEGEECDQLVEAWKDSGHAR